MRHEGSYPAERSKVMELGAKWLLREGDLALRAALYRADKDWERNTPNFTFNMWSRYNLGGG